MDGHSGHGHHGGGASQFEEELRIADTLSRVKHKLMVMSGKGGVGKSTVAVNLAVALAQMGHQVGLVDIDLHGPSVPSLLGIQNRVLDVEGDKLLPLETVPGLKVLSIANVVNLGDQAVIWRGPMKISAIRQFLSDIKWGDLDFMIIDAPPGTGDEPLTAAQTVKGVRAVIVTTPQEIALADVRKSITFCNKLNMPVLGIIENLSGYDCPKCGHHEDLFSTGGGERLAERFRMPFLGRLPIDPNVVKSGDAGQPYLATNRESPAAKAFQAIAAKVKELAFAETPPPAESIPGTPAK